MGESVLNAASIGRGRGTCSRSLKETLDGMVFAWPRLRGERPSEGGSDESSIGWTKSTRSLGEGSNEGSS